MDKKELVAIIAKRVDIDPGKAVLAMDAVVSEIVTPHLIKPGGEVALLDNNCNNNCPEQIAREAMRDVRRK